MKRYFHALNHEMVVAQANCIISSKARRTIKNYSFKATVSMVLWRKEERLKFHITPSK